MIAICILIFCFFLLWVFGFSKANDLSIITQDIQEVATIKRVLVIFPHPDDEAQTTTGTISRLVKSGVEVSWIVLTKGERGTDDAHIDDKLKAIRVKEAQKVAKLIGVNSLSFYDYPDNDVTRFRNNLVEDIRKAIAASQPDLVITYDESGGYGHPDHIVVSSAITTLLQSDFPKIHLWYTSTPKKLFTQLNLPEQMAKNKKFKSDRLEPNFKVWIGLSGIVTKINSVYAYQSQFSAFIKSVPIKQIPMWFYISLMPFEYFYKVK
jgi:LmbE family N-acetylglucosaminyl deacetylase